MGIAYGSDAAVDFADESMEAVSYYAIETSSNLAIERGAYSTFKGSLWDQGILPIDSLKSLQNHVQSVCLKLIVLNVWTGIRYV